MLLRRSTNNPRTGVSCNVAAVAGFTLVEIMVVVGIMAAMAAMAALIMPSAVKGARSDSGARRVTSILRTAREQAVAERRNVQVTFTAPNRIVTARVEYPGPGTTTLGAVVLEGNVEFGLVSGVPDTPDAFGNSSALSFGSATTLLFTSEGTFVDQHGDPVNGTVFLANSGDGLSARAVTIFGPTALIREWRWDGRQWTN